MDPQTFIPPNTDRIKGSVADFALLKEAVRAYFSCDFSHMKGFILEYGEGEFFEDMNKYFNAGRWNNPANKYATFVGMTIAFYKMY